MTRVHFGNLGDDPMADMIRRHEDAIASAIAEIHHECLRDAVLVVTEYTPRLAVVGATSRARFFTSETFRRLGTQASREELRAWPTTRGRILLVATRVSPRGWGFSELEIRDDSN